MKAPPAGSGALTHGRAMTALGVLFLIGVVNYVDRATMSILQVPVKAELGFSDTRLGALTGIAFFIPYLLLSIPVARLADVWNRRLILLFALILWSGMTALLGAASDFTTMVILRMGVAIGEACCLPTAYSMISDMFRPQQRGRAVAIFGMSYPVGSMVGLTSIGVMGAALGWRATFVIVGCIGFALIPLILFFLPEPERGGADAVANREPAPPIGAALAAIWRIRSFRYAVLGLGVQSLTGYAVVIWSAPYYARAFDLNLAEVGVMLGLMLGVAGGASVFLGGYLADRLGRIKGAWYMWVCAIGSLLFLPASLLQFWTPSLPVSLAAGFVSALFSAVYLAPVNAVAQSLVAPRLRALIAGVITTVSAIAGGSLGPLLVGTLSDHSLASNGGDGAAALRFAMLVTVMLALLAVAAFLWAARHVDRDMRALVSQARGEAGE